MLEVFISLILFFDIELGVPVKEKRTWTFYESGPFKWTSFAEFRKQVLALGSSFISKLELKPKDRIGIFANTCPEWFNYKLAFHTNSKQVSYSPRCCISIYRRRYSLRKSRYYPNLISISFTFFKAKKDLHTPSTNPNSLVYSHLLIF